MKFIIYSIFLLMQCIDVFSFFNFNTNIYRDISFNIRKPFNICRIKMNINDPMEYSKFLSQNRKPIPIISFDDIILNSKQIVKAFLSTTCDRIVIFYGDKKGVYYIDKTNKNIISNIQFILSETNLDIRVEHFFHMDNPSHELYCEPKKLIAYTEETNEIDEIDSNHEDYNTFSLDISYEDE